MKHSRLLLRHARKYLRYKDDQLNQSDREQVLTGMNALREALRERDRGRIHTAADALDKTLHRLTPVTWESHWRENCEVILVAIVVAVGIRSYFLQPFKIPTGSMQPTLNGIIGYPSMAPAPNILRQVGEFIVLGRNYIDVVSREDDQLLEIQPRKMFFFFTFSQLICQRQKYLVYAAPDTLSHDFNVFPGRVYRRGEIIARGAIDTGDQVFVDKFSYNFIKPHRGDVFVFRTNHIPGIREDPEAGSPFYIKRLGGLPGDTLRIDSPFLYVNGKKAEGYGFAREMAAKPPYRGYAPGHTYLATPQQTYKVPPHGYFALGDNSYNSYDSRYWGPVPEENLVGRGLLVYWPFHPHWGLIR
ncbi:MAG TPA: signal peptidase I [Candidatus Udaeobacter sp.]|nr:signal peptidase I [Candidatus Udaeobacter sp.]